MRQPWFCEICKVSAIAVIPNGASAGLGFSIIRKQHQGMSPSCGENIDALCSRIRVRNPALCSRSEWKDYIQSQKSKP